MQRERTKDHPGALDRTASPAGERPAGLRRPRRFVAAVVSAAAPLALCLAAAPALAAPGDDQAGRGLFFFAKHDCKRAVPWLEQAERIHHRPSTAVALAECYLARGDLLQASRILHRVAEEKPVRGWRRPDYNANKAAKTKVPQVDARVPTLRLDAPEGVTGLTVEIDGVAVDDVGAARPVAPGVEVSVVARADGRRELSEKVVLQEGERRVLVLRLPPIAPRAEPPAKAKAGRLPTSWLGVRYYGVVIPKFVMSFVADGGRSLVVPGGALTFTKQVNDVEVTAALGYLSFRMGNTPFKGHGDPDTDWELDSSSLQGFTATVDLMWGFPIDAAGNVAFRVGGAAGFGWMALGDLYREQIYPANGMPGDPSTYLVCKGPNDPRGTYRYCNALDKDATHYPGYTEPDWFHHGIRPSLFPWLVLPQLGFRFRPSREVTIDLDTGVSIAGFLTSLGVRFGL